MSLTWSLLRGITTDKTYFEGECLSTDTKPTGDYILNGSKLIEMDTSKVYIYDADNELWREFA